MRVGQGWSVLCGAALMLSLPFIREHPDAVRTAIAQKNVAANPNSASAWIALSYAQQARFDLPEARASVEKAVALTPGIESPTVSPLHREGWVAVRAMVPRDGAQKLMDDLYEIGARAILLTDIHACRL